MKKRNLAFTVELLGLFILLILVITVITQVFVMSRAHSLEARRLTEAVIIAEDIAEISSTVKDADALHERISGLIGEESVIDSNTEGTGGNAEAAIIFDYVLGGQGKTAAAGGTDGSEDVAAPAPEGYVYRVKIERTTEPAAKGVYAEDVISVYSAAEIDAASASIGKAGPLGISDTSDMPEPIYELKAGKYFGEDK